MDAYLLPSRDARPTRQVTSGGAAYYAETADATDPAMAAATDSWIERWIEAKATPELIEAARQGLSPVHFSAQPDTTQLFSF